jgi:hypothetical protein
MTAEIVQPSTGNEGYAYDERISARSLRIEDFDLIKTLGTGAHLSKWKVQETYRD